MKLLETLPWNRQKMSALLYSRWLSSKLAIYSPESDWCLDSGAAAHMSGPRRAFSELHKVKPVQIQLANRRTITADKRGTVFLTVNTEQGQQNIRLVDVLYVPQLQGNLFSVSTSTFM